MEDKLANQDNVKEDVDQLRNQINAMKVRALVALLLDSVRDGLVVLRELLR